MIDGASELIRMAARNVVRNRRRSAITGVMVAVGVAAVVFAGAYIEGLQRLILRAAIEGRTGALQVQRKGVQASQDLAPLELDLPSDPALLASIRGTPGVTELAPRLRFMGMIAAGEVDSTMISGIGVDPALDPVVCPLGPTGERTVTGTGHDAFQLVAGRTLEKVDEPGIVLGVELGTALGVKPGDSVTLLARTRGGSLDAVDLTVAGLFRFDDPFENKHTVIVPLGVAQKLLHMSGRVSTYAIAIADWDRADAIAAALRDRLANGEPAVEVLTWAQLSPYFRDVLELQDNVLRFVMGIVFLLVLAGVANTMLMSVFERTREVGTLLCLGFERAEILLLFLFEAAFLGAGAAVVGGVAGTSLVAWAHQRGIPFQIPAVGVIMNRPVIDTPDLVMAIAAALLAAIGAGLYPANRAAGLQPVEALRVH